MEAFWLFPPHLLFFFNSPFFCHAEARIIQHSPYSRRLPIQGRQGPHYLCGQGARAAPPGALLFSARRPARQNAGHAFACREHRVPDHDHGKRGPAAGSQLHQKAQAALQHRAARRQAVRAFSHQSQASLSPAGNRAAGAAGRRALFRPVHVCSGGARNVEAHPPRLCPAALHRQGHEKPCAPLPVSFYGAMPGALHGHGDIAGIQRKRAQGDGSAPGALCRAAWRAARRHGTGRRRTGI